MDFASSIYRRLLPYLVALLPLTGAFASDWQVVVSPTDDDLHGVFFLDAETGWIIAHESGEVLHTADGGVTWTVRAGVDRGALEWLMFEDPRRGWICGEKGRIYRTEDGGETWRQTGPGGRRFGCSSLFFAGSDGLALGVDLGSSRRLDDLRPVIYDLADDGGSWTKRDLDLPGVAFTDALAALGERTLVAGGFGVVYRSEDGGGTWAMIPLAGADDRRAVRGLSFVDASVGWAVGSDGLVARTDDGGRRWRLPPPVTRHLLRDVLFVDSRNGFIVGERGPERGLIYRTTDGGETWRDVDGDHPPLHRILAAGDHLWIVGAKGTILRRPKPVPPPPLPLPPPEEVPPTSQAQ